MTPEEDSLLQMNQFFARKEELDVAFYSRQIFPAVHIAAFQLVSKTALEVKTPTVAVVMPVFNTNQHFLKESILSILKSQTYKGTIYLIIVDDGSTDPKTVKMLDSCKQSNENVILHRLKTNQGLPYALNQGIKIAIEKGVEFIARMDSDDISVPERIET